MRGTSVKELEESGEDTTGVIESKSKLRSKVKSLSGVDILTDTGAYKSTYEILLEISKVWDDISDVDQAALLEILAGKNRSNTAAAILSNTKDLEEAFASAQNAEGSALAENEKYLDSIQGKIDQFTNSYQALWSHLLDSDAIKFFVEQGTEIIKSLDTVQGKLLAIVKVAAILMAYKKFNPLQWLTTVQSQGGIISYIASVTGLGKAFGLVTAQTATNTIAMQINDKEQREATISSLGLANAKGFLTQAQKKNTIQTLINNQSINKLTNEEIIATAALFGLKVGFDQATGSLVILDATTKSFMATNPVGWILAIISVLATVITLLSQVESKEEKLQEKLSDLKSELSDIRSELEDVNSELETTNDRMAELLYKDSLTFTEKEELNNLRKQNDELQRRIDLLTLEEKQKKAETAKSFVETMQSDVANQREYYVDIDGTKKVNWLARLAEGSLGTEFERISESDHINAQIQDYQHKIEQLADIEQQIIGAGGEQTEEGKALAKRKQKINDDIGEIESYVSGKIIDFNKRSADLSYGINDKTDKWLDYIYDLEDKWAIASGGSNAKTNAVNRIFNKNEFAEASQEIDKYVNALKNGDSSAETSIRNIITNTDGLADAFDNIGMSVDDAVGYFTMLAGDSVLGTIEGRMEKLGEATTKFEQLLHGQKFSIDIDGKGTMADIGLQELFDEEGKVIQTNLSQIFAGSGDQALKDITVVLEGAYDEIEAGTADIEQLLHKVGIKFQRQLLDINSAQLTDLNKELFPNLEDEISGIIDNFNELASAVGSVVDAMDLLDEARKEEEHSGSISLETLSKLMEYTDDYAELVEIDETGAITLASNAQEILIDQKLEAIKANARQAVATAELAVQEIEAAQTTDTFSEVIKNTVNKTLMQTQGLFAGAMSLLNDWTSGNFEGAWGRATSAYNNTVTSLEEKETAAAAQSYADAKAALEKAQNNLKIAEGLTADNVQTRYSSSKASGDDDEASEAFQEDMDYWENRISANQAKYEQIQNEIDLLEAKGQRAGAEYYQEQIKLENQRKDLLEQQKAEALDRLDELEKAGREGSDEWWDVANTINSIEGELDDVIANVLELNNAIGELRWYGFEELHKRFSNLTTDLENIRDILSNEDMFDDQGNWTEEGVATLATYIQDMEIYKNSLTDVQKELADFQQGYAGNEDYFATIGIDSEQEYYDKLIELTDEQDEYVKKIKDSEQSVVEMYENQIDAIEDYTSDLVDHYNDYIDSVKEALDAERDLYEFKKNVQKQTKDIASLERRIASLSGSSAAADIAERRKLEAQLLEAKEGLDDTYYDHAKDAQQQALDEEAQAYEESMNRYIEGLRTTLEEATNNMSTFLSTVANVVIQNSGSVSDAYKNTGLALDAAIVDPWTSAAEAMSDYEENALTRMNDWTKSGSNGYFYNFNAAATTQLKSPWTAGTTAANQFATDVNTAMKNVYDSVQSNVDKSLTKLNSLTNGIQDSNKKTDGTVDADNPTTPDKGSSGNSMSKEDVKKLQYVLNEVFGANIKEDGSYGSATKSAVKKAQKTIGVDQDGYYGPTTRIKMSDYIRYKWQANNGSSSAIGQGIMTMLNKLPTSYYAKGTLGTKRDEFAITDESWIGEEITLAAGKNGQLQYLKKGSAVMPADISANLVEWGKINPNMMNMPNVGANVNMISNAVNKPEFNLAFEALVKAERIDENTLPEVKKFVQQEINNLVRQMNYSLKRSGAR